jgi:hypothetical protein
MTHRLVALLTTLALIGVLVAGAPVANARAVFTKRFVPKIPISLPVPTATGPNAITFDNVLDHVSELPEVAWTRVQETIAANAPVAIKTLVYTGPNTTYDIIGGGERIKEIIAYGAAMEWLLSSQIGDGDLVQLSRPRLGRKQMGKVGEQSKLSVIRHLPFQQLLAKLPQRSVQRR